MNEENKKVFIDIYSPYFSKPQPVIQANMMTMLSQANHLLNNPTIPANDGQDAISTVTQLFDLVKKVYKI